MSLHRFAGLKLKGLIGVGPLFDGSMNLKEKKKENLQQMRLKTGWVWFRLFHLQTSILDDETSETTKSTNYFS